MASTTHMGRPLTRLMLALSVAVCSCTVTTHRATLPGAPTTDGASATEASTTIEVASPNEEDPPATMSGPHYAVYYESVEALVRDADVVLVGEVVAEPISYMSLGYNEDGSVAANSEIPALLHEVEVESVFGDVDVPGSIFVNQIDPVVAPWERQSPFEVGDRILLFLDRLGPDDYSVDVDSADIPWLTHAGEIFVRLSGDMGVFDVEDGMATARSSEIKAMTESDLAEGNFQWINFRLEEVADLVKSAKKRPSHSS